MHWDDKREEWVDDPGDNESSVMTDDDGAVVVRVGGGGGRVQQRPRPAPPPQPQQEYEPEYADEASQDAELEQVDAKLAEAGFYRAFLQNPSMFGEVGPGDSDIVARVEGAFRRFARQQIAALFGRGQAPAESVFSAAEIANLRRLAAAFPGDLEVAALQRFAAHAAGSTKIMTAPKTAPVRVAPIQAPQRGQRPAAPAPRPQAAPPPPAARQKPKPPAPKMPRVKAARPPGALPMPTGAALSLALDAQVAAKIEEAQEGGAPPGAMAEAGIKQMLLQKTAQALSGLVKQNG